MGNQGKEEEVKLQRRELITISLGGIILLGALGYRLIGSISSNSATGTETLVGAIARINDYSRLKHSVETLSGQMSLQVPTSSAGDQETGIMDDIGRRAKERSLQLSSLKPGQPSGRGRSNAIKPVQFRLEIAGRFDSVMEFVYSLEHAPTAYVVSEMHIEGSGKSGRGRAMLAELMGIPPPADQSDPNQPQSPSNGGVRVTMKIQSYLFPVLESAKSTEEKKTS